MKHIREKLIDLKRCFVDDGHRYSNKPYTDEYAEKTHEFSSSDRAHGDCVAVMSFLNKQGNWYNGKLKVLDFGCGTGVNLARFYQIGRINASGLTGIDQSVECIEKARSLYPGFKFIASVSDQIPYPSNSADLVTLFHSLAHVENVAPTLSELYRVTVPGGRVAVVTPNCNYVLAMAPKNLFNDYLPDTTILRHFTMQTLVQALWCSGFDIEHHQYFGELPFDRFPHCFRSRLIIVARKPETKTDVEA